MKNRWHKTCALFLIVTFSVMDILTPYAAYGAISVPSASEVSVPSFGFSLDMPTELGTIESLHSGSGPTLVHIQTAHGNYEAQKNIQKILQHLYQEYGFKHLLLEGTSFELDSELLNLLPNRPEDTREILDRLTRKALVKGPELFLVDHPDARGYGIERLDSYLANGDAFRSVLMAQEKSETFLEVMDQQIDRLAGTYLNTNLRQFVKLYEKYEMGRYPFQDWLHALRDHAKEYLEIELDNPAFQIDWPMLLRVNTLEKIESEINLSKYRKERTDFLNNIRKLLPEAIYQKVEKLTENPRNPHHLSDPETYLLVEKMMESLPGNFRIERYPEVTKILGRMILHSELEGEALMTEMERLTELVSNKMAKSKVEKEVLKVLRDYWMLEKLFALELTPKEYIKLKSRENSLQPHQIAARFEEINRADRVRGIEFKNLESIDQLFSESLRFYRHVGERDQDMIRNVTQKMDELQTSKAVIVTGGFHANPFQKFFQAQDYNYALILPNISSMDGKKEYIESILDIQVPASTFESVPFGSHTDSRLTIDFKIDPTRVNSLRLRFLSALHSVLAPKLTGAEINQELATSPALGDYEIRRVRGPKKQPGYGFLKNNERVGWAPETQSQIVTTTTYSTVDDSELISIPTETVPTRKVASDTAVAASETRGIFKPYDATESKARLRKIAQDPIVNGFRAHAKEFGKIIEQARLIDIDSPDLKAVAKIKRMLKRLRENELTLTRGAVGFSISPFKGLSPLTFHGVSQGSPEEPIHAHPYWETGHGIVVYIVGAALSNRYPKTSLTKAYTVEKYVKPKKSLESTAPVSATVKLKAENLEEARKGMQKLAKASSETRAGKRIKAPRSLLQPLIEMREESKRRIGNRRVINVSSIEDETKKAVSVVKMDTAGVRAQTLGQSTNDIKFDVSLNMLDTGERWHNLHFSFDSEDNILNIYSVVIVQQSSMPERNLAYQFAFDLTAVSLGMPMEHYQSGQEPSFFKQIDGEQRTPRGHVLTVSYNTVSDQPVIILQDEVVGELLNIADDDPQNKNGYRTFLEDVRQDGLILSESEAIALKEANPDNLPGVEIVEEKPIKFEHLEGLVFLAIEGEAPFRGDLDELAIFLNTKLKTYQPLTAPYVDSDAGKIGLENSEGVRGVVDLNEVTEQAEQTLQTLLLPIAADDGLSATAQSETRQRALQRAEYPELENAEARMVRYLRLISDDDRTNSEDLEVGRLVQLFDDSGPKTFTALTRVFEQEQSTLVDILIEMARKRRFEQWSNFFSLFEQIAYKHNVHHGYMYALNEIPKHINGVKHNNIDESYALETALGDIHNRIEEMRTEAEELDEVESQPHLVLAHDSGGLTLAVVEFDDEPQTAAPKLDNAEETILDYLKLMTGEVEVDDLSGEIGLVTTRLWDSSENTLLAIASVLTDHDSDLSQWLLRHVREDKEGLDQLIVLINGLARAHQKFTSGKTALKNLQELFQITDLNAGGNNPKLQTATSLINDNHVNLSRLEDMSGLTLSPDRDDDFFAQSETRAAVFVDEGDHRAIGETDIFVGNIFSQDQVEIAVGNQNNKKTYDVGDNIIPGYVISRIDTLSRQVEISDAKSETRTSSKYNFNESGHWLTQYWQEANWRHIFLQPNIQAVSSLTGERVISLVHEVDDAGAIVNVPPARIKEGLSSNVDGTSIVANHIITEGELQVSLTIGDQAQIYKVGDSINHVISVAEIVPGTIDNTGEEEVTTPGSVLLKINRKRVLEVNGSGDQQKVVSFLLDVMKRGEGTETMPVSYRLLGDGRLLVKQGRDPNFAKDIAVARDVQGQPKTTEIVRSWEEFDHWVDSMRQQVGSPLHELHFRDAEWRRALNLDPIGDRLIDLTHGDNPIGEDAQVGERLHKEFQDRFQIDKDHPVQLQWSVVAGKYHRLEIMNVAKSGVDTKYSYDKSGKYIESEDDLEKWMEGFAVPNLEARSSVTGKRVIRRVREVNAKNKKVLREKKLKGALAASDLYDFVAETMQGEEAGQVAPISYRLLADGTVLVTKGREMYLAYDQLQAVKDVTSWDEFEKWVNKQRKETGEELHELHFMNPLWRESMGFTETIGDRLIDLTEGKKPISEAAPKKLGSRLKSEYQKKIGKISKKRPLRLKWTRVAKNRYRLEIENLANGFTAKADSVAQSETRAMNFVKVGEMQPIMQLEDDRTEFYRLKLGRGPTVANQLLNLMPWLRNRTSITDAKQLDLYNNGIWTNSIELIALKQPDQDQFILAGFYMDLPGLETDRTPSGHRQRNLPARQLVLIWPENALKFDLALAARELKKMYDFPDDYYAPENEVIVVATSGNIVTIDLEKNTAAQSETRAGTLEENLRLGVDFFQEEIARLIEGAEVRTAPMTTLPMDIEQARKDLEAGDIERTIQMLTLVMLNLSSPDIRQEAAKQRSGFSLATYERNVLSWADQGYEEYPVGSVLAYLIALSIAFSSIYEQFLIIPEVIEGHRAQRAETSEPLPREVTSELDTLENARRIAQYASADPFIYETVPDGMVNRNRLDTFLNTHRSSLDSIVSYEGRINANIASNWAQRVDPEILERVNAALEKIYHPESGSIASARSLIARLRALTNLSEGQAQSETRATIPRLGPFEIQEDTVRVDGDITLTKGDILANPETPNFLYFVQRAQGRSIWVILLNPDGSKLDPADRTGTAMPRLGVDGWYLFPSETSDAARAQSETRVDNELSEEGEWLPKYFYFAGSAQEDFRKLMAGVGARLVTTPNDSYDELEVIVQSESSEEEKVYKVKRGTPAYDETMRLLFITQIDLKNLKESGTNYRLSKDYWKSIGLLTFGNMMFPIVPGALMLLIEYGLGIELASSRELGRQTIGLLIMLVGAAIPGILFMEIAGQPYSSRDQVRDRIQSQIQAYIEVLDKDIDEDNVAQSETRATIPRLGPFEIQEDTVRVDGDITLTKGDILANPETPNFLYFVQRAQGRSIWVILLNPDGSKLDPADRLGTAMPRLDVEGWYLFPSEKNDATRAQSETRAGTLEDNLRLGIDYFKQEIRRIDLTGDTDSPSVQTARSQIDLARAALDAGDITKTIGRLTMIMTYLSMQDARKAAAVDEGKGFSFEGLKQNVLSWADQVVENHPRATFLAYYVASYILLVDIERALNGVSQKIKEHRAERAQNPANKLPDSVPSQLGALQLPAQDVRKAAKDYLILSSLARGELNEVTLKQGWDQWHKQVTELRQYDALTQEAIAAKWEGYVDPEVLEQIQGALEKVYDEETGYITNLLGLIERAQGYLAQSETRIDFDDEFRLTPPDDFDRGDDSDDSNEIIALEDSEIYPDDLGEGDDSSTDGAQSETRLVDSDLQDLSEAQKAKLGPALSIWITEQPNKGYNLMTPGRISPTSMELDLNEEIALDFAEPRDLAEQRVEYAAHLIKDKLVSTPASVINEQEGLFLGILRNQLKEASAGFQGWFPFLNWNAHKDLELLSENIKAVILVLARVYDRLGMINYKEAPEAPRAQEVRVHRDEEGSAQSETRSQKSEFSERYGAAEQQLEDFKVLLSPLLEVLALDGTGDLADKNERLVEMGLDNEEALLSQLRVAYQFIAQLNLEVIELKQIQAKTLEDLQKEGVTPDINVLAVNFALAQLEEEVIQTTDEWRLVLTSAVEDFGIEAEQVGRAASETRGAKVNQLEEYPFLADPNFQQAFLGDPNVELTFTQKQAFEFRIFASEPITVKQFGENVLQRTGARGGQVIKSAVKKAVNYYRDVYAVQNVQGDDPYTTLSIFSVRADQKIKSLGVTTVNDLRARVRQELNGVNNLGETSLEEVLAVFMRRGVGLRVYDIDEEDTEAFSDNLPLTKLGFEDLSVRGKLTLTKIGIFTVGDIRRISEDQLRESPSFRPNVLEDIQSWLDSKGVQIGSALSETRTSSEDAEMDDLEWLRRARTEAELLGLRHDDEFLLQRIDDEEDTGGSQVIALEDSAPFDDGAEVIAINDSAFEQLADAFRERWGDALNEMGLTEASINMVGDLFIKWVTNEVDQGSFIESLRRIDRAFHPQKYPEVSGVRVTDDAHSSYNMNRLVERFVIDLHDYDRDMSGFIAAFATFAENLEDNEFREAFIWLDSGNWHQEVARAFPLDTPNRFVSIQRPDEEPLTEDELRNFRSLSIADPEDGANFLRNSPLGLEFEPGSFRRSGYYGLELLGFRRNIHNTEAYFRAIPISTTSQRQEFMNRWNDLHVLQGPVVTSHAIARESDLVRIASWIREEIQNVRAGNPDGITALAAARWDRTDDSSDIAQSEVRLSVEDAKDQLEGILKDAELTPQLKWYEGLKDSFKKPGDLVNFIENMVSYLKDPELAVNPLNFQLQRAIIELENLMSDIDFGNTVDFEGDRNAASETRVIRDNVEQYRREHPEIKTEEFQAAFLDSGIGLSQWESLLLRERIFTDKPQRRMHLASSQEIPENTLAGYERVLLGKLVRFLRNGFQKTPTHYDESTLREIAIQDRAIIVPLAVGDIRKVKDLKPLTEFELRVIYDLNDGQIQKIRNQFGEHGIKPLPQQGDVAVKSAEDIQDDDPVGVLGLSGLSKIAKKVIITNGIRTVGDFKRISEAKILEGRNIGKGSVDPIKELLSSKGIELGSAVAPDAPITQTFEDSDPVENLGLDQLVPSLRTAIRLIGIKTVGDFKSPEMVDLLGEQRSVGVTRINELRDWLAKRGIELGGGQSETRAAKVNYLDEYPFLADSDFQDAFLSADTKLTANQRKALERRVFAENPLTLEALGEKVFGRSTERARQIEAQAVSRAIYYYNNVYSSTADTSDDQPYQNLGAFSNRARKAFVKLGIVTIGDLKGTTADDLLEVKNFGTTTLDEVEGVLKLRGFSLASSADDQWIASKAKSGAITNETRILQIGARKLSLRTRKAFVRLNIQTVGDLRHTTADTLLRAKNFGETSLQEVLDWLEPLGIELGSLSPVKEFQPASDSDLITELGVKEELSPRARTIFQKLNVERAGDFKTTTEADLRSVAGPSSNRVINEIAEWLETKGIVLGSARSETRTLNHYEILETIDAVKSAHKGNTDVTEPLGQATQISWQKRSSRLGRDLRAAVVGQEAYDMAADYVKEVIDLGVAPEGPLTQEQLAKLQEAEASLRSPLDFDWQLDASRPDVGDFGMSETRAPKRSELKLAAHQEVVAKTVMRGLIAMHIMNTLGLLAKWNLVKGLVGIAHAAGVEVDDSVDVKAEDFPVGSFERGYLELNKTVAANKLDAKRQVVDHRKNVPSSPGALDKIVRTALSDEKNLHYELWIDGEVGDFEDQMKAYALAKYGKAPANLSIQQVNGDLAGLFQNEIDRDQAMAFITHDEAIAREIGYHANVFRVKATNLNDDQRNQVGVITQATLLDEDTFQQLNTDVFDGNDLINMWQQLLQDLRKSVAFQKSA